MDEIKVTRQQHEVLRVNGKIVTVESGIIVNGYDLTPKENIAVSRFINAAIHKHVANSIKSLINKY